VKWRVEYLEDEERWGGVTNDPRTNRVKLVDGMLEGRDV
jgi:hypothetical protein